MRCLRCSESFGNGVLCQECGVHKNRVVRRHRARKIGGKRGRNSGKVHTSKKKNKGK